MGVKWVEEDIYKRELRKNYTTCPPLGYCENTGESDEHAIKNCFVQGIKFIPGFRACVSS